MRTIFDIRRIKNMQLHPLRNLTVIRRLVQLAAFLFLVYGGAWTGFYLADKLSVALPALSCAYDAKAPDLCVLIPFQHQLDHRIGEAIAGGKDVLKAALGLLFTFGLFLFLFVMLNKAFCGWLCPVGTVQEWLHLLAGRLGLRQKETLEEPRVRRLRPVKWALLGGLVLGLPLLTGMGVTGHDWGDPFWRICPSRVITSLASGDASQVFVDRSSPSALALSATGMFLFGLVVALAMRLRQPFCRICPMLALHALFRRVGLLRLVKQASPKCEGCGMCARACPMDIREIHTEMEQRFVTFDDCTLCGRCVEFCPHREVLQLKYGPLPVFVADPAYFKPRVAAQKAWEKGRAARKET